MVVPFMSDPIRIATRQSPLALWQANNVKDQLLALHPQLSIELLPLTTKGDREQSTSLAKIGGKGLFLKELETALMDKSADLAVHSMKDVTAHIPDGLAIFTLLERHNPADALVSNRFNSIDELPDYAVIGTCSPRRQAQLLHFNPTFRIVELRGNVGTRPTAYRSTAERAFSARLNGGCSAPIAAYATIESDRIHMNARVIELDGSRLLHAQGSASLKDAHSLGTNLAVELLEQGAQDILDRAEHGQSA